jgi:hypothetical protein
MSQIQALCKDYENIDTLANIEHEPRAGKKAATQEKKSKQNSE